MTVKRKRERERETPQRKLLSLVKTEIMIISRMWIGISRKESNDLDLYQMLSSSPSPNQLFENSQDYILVYSLNFLVHLMMMCCNINGRRRENQSGKSSPSSSSFDSRCSRHYHHQVGRSKDSQDEGDNDPFLTIPLVVLLHSSSGRASSSPWSSCSYWCMVLLTYITHGNENDDMSRSQTHYNLIDIPSEKKEEEKRRENTKRGCDASTSLMMMNKKEKKRRTGG